MLTNTLFTPTADIQSELHQKKRRFTDFIFQRVNGFGDVGASASEQKQSTTTATAGDVSSNAEASGVQRNVPAPRAVSGFATTSSSSGPVGGIGLGGVPRVRVTSPGAEFRDGRKSQRGTAGGSGSGGGVAAAGRKVLRPSSSRVSLRSQSRSRGNSPLRRKGSSAQLSGSSSPSVAPSIGGSLGVSNLRRFHLSKPAALSGKISSGGIQKKRGADRAILVEKLSRKPGTEGSSIFKDIGLKNGGTKTSGNDDAMKEDVDVVVDMDSGGIHIAAPTTARKRPVVNKAEKRWRAEQSLSRSHSKTNLTEENKMAEKTGKSVRDHPSNWDHSSDQLAQELQQLALEIMMEDSKSSTVEKPVEKPVEKTAYAPTPIAGISTKRPQLKYQPRPPPQRFRDRIQNQEHASKPVQTDNAEDKLRQNQNKDTDAPKTDTPLSGSTVEKDAARDEDSDGDYVYDTYVRQPLPPRVSTDHDAAVAAAASAETILSAARLPIPINGDQSSRNIGIVVISEEDEEYWDTYAVEDDSEKEWDSEDEDSNAEDHPSNDYPDEELESDDEDDDPTAIYRKYRYRAASDDEQDVDDYEDEGEYGYGGEDVDSDGEVVAGGGRGGFGMGMGWR